MAAARPPGPRVLETAERAAVGFNLHDLELLPTAEEDRLVGHLGPDLLDPAWSDGHAAEALRRFTARGASELGLVLLEQRVVAGVGNLYKTEVCFLAGLSPWTLVRDVPDPAAVIDLARTLLLRNKDRPQQSTTGELARGRQHWVYDRGGRRCRRCGTRIRTGHQAPTSTPGWPGGAPPASPALPHPDSPALRPRLARSGTPTRGDRSPQFRESRYRCTRVAVWVHASRGLGARESRSGCTRVAVCERRRRPVLAGRAASAGVLLRRCRAAAAC
ncbi:hypothetical protein BJF90_41330 [Pseudonocardia sp. CNS-004]|nr:hypothetical protein BJF90_41330 [Pseudonocardia sp. CNS-004]